jgi:thymidylate kinase
LNILILGVDGSGKTTVIRNVTTSLDSHFVPKVFHLKPSLKISSGTSAIVRDPHALPPRSNIVSFLKLVSWLLLYWIFYFRDITKNHAVLTVWDRYIYDVLVDPVRYRINLSESLIKFLCWFAPRPDIVFVLRVRGDIAFKRKGELSPKLLDQINERYVGLERNFGWVPVF